MCVSPLWPNLTHNSLALSVPQWPRMSSKSLYAAFPAHKCVCRPLARLNICSNANTPLPTPWPDISIYRVRMRQLRQRQKEKRRLIQDPCYINEEITRGDCMMSERRTGEARRSLPIYQFKLPSIPIIYIPNPFSTWQSSIEGPVQHRGSSTPNNISTIYPFDLTVCN